MEHGGTGGREHALSTGARGHGGTGAMGQWSTGARGHAGSDGRTLAEGSASKSAASEVSSEVRKMANSRPQSSTYIWWRCALVATSVYASCTTPEPWQWVMGGGWWVVGGEW